MVCSTDKFFLIQMFTNIRKNTHTKVKMTLKNVLLSLVPTVATCSFTDVSSEPLQNANIWARYKSSAPSKLLCESKEGKLAANLCLQGSLEKE